MSVSMTPMALAHPPNAIKSRSGNKRRNLWVGWYISSRRRWFWPMYSIYYMFVVVNCDALAQASDFQIEIRQVVFLCWMQDSNQGLWNRISSKLNARWAIEEHLRTWTQQLVPMISEHTAYSTPLPFGFRTWPWWYICLLLLISMLWHRQAIFKS